MTLMQTSKEIPIEERIANLKERVIKGNQVLFDLAQKEKTLNKDEREKFGAVIHQKSKVLNGLCLELHCRGFQQCLYTDGRACFTSDGWFCFACPKSIDEKYIDAE